MYGEIGSLWHNAMHSDADATCTFMTSKIQLGLLVTTYKLLYYYKFF